MIFLLAVYLGGFLFTLSYMLLITKLEGCWDEPMAIAAALAGAICWPLVVIATFAKIFQAKKGKPNG